MTRLPSLVVGAPDRGTTPFPSAPATGSVQLDRARRRLLPSIAFVRQLASFGAIGAVSFLVDFGVYNLLRVTLLEDKPIAAKAVSVAVATLVAWLGNRYVTFRSDTVRQDRRAAVREGLLFAAMNLVGLGIAAACLFVSHYVLGFTSTLADNVAGNGIGLVLGTAFRFAAYKAIVFRPARRPKEATAE